VVVCPPPEGKHWHLALDTGLQSPEDFYAVGEEPRIEPQDRYRAVSRSLVVLLSK
jgi:hypothetical protein